MTNAAFPTRPTRRAFTLVELLAAVTVIGILLGIIFVALGSAQNQAKASLATRQLATIQQGVSQFEADFGYLPPLLNNYTGPGAAIFGGPDKVLVTPEGQASFAPTLETQARFLSQAYQIPRYASEFSIAAYLIGIADLNGTGVVNSDDLLLAADDGDDGVVGPGIRDPGPDRAWGGAASKPVDADQWLTPRGGQVYGPYINAADLTDSIEARRLTGGNNEYIGYRVLDPWGNPIRYYLNWPTKDPTLTGTDLLASRSVDFMPVELRSVGSVDAQFRGNSPDLSLDRTALNSRFALLSPGAAPTAVYTNSDGDDTDLPPFGDALVEDGTRFIVQQEDPPAGLTSLSEAIQSEFASNDRQDRIIADLETNILIGSQ